MGEREWKPGEVALRTGPDGAQTLSLVVQVRRGFGDCENEHGYGPHWHHANGGWNQIPDDPKWGTYRPLVVIDPEDREQVERLARASHDAIHKAGDFDSKTDLSRGVLTELMQAALREFADPKPPKPDEPTGLGAVVEDESGELWIRTCEPCDRCLNKPWQQGPVHKNWQIVDAVRVLSEGVTP